MITTRTSPPATTTTTSTLATTTTTLATPLQVKELLNNQSHWAHPDFVWDISYTHSEWTAIWNNHGMFPELTDKYEAIIAECEMYMLPSLLGADGDEDYSPYMQKFVREIIKQLTEGYFKDNEHAHGLVKYWNGPSDYDYSGDASGDREDSGDYSGSSGDYSGESSGFYGSGDYSG